MVASTPAITLDKSKKYGTVHGDRTPDDPHYNVQFMQDGLPFDVDGNLVPDDGKTSSWSSIIQGEKGPINVIFQPLYTKKTREILARKLTRLTRAAASLEVPEEEQEEEAEDSAVDDVNLEEWLRGKANYQAFKIFKACRERYSRNHTSLKSVVIDLVLDESLIPEDELTPALKRLLPDQVAA